MSTHDPTDVGHQIDAFASGIGPASARRLKAPAHRATVLQFIDAGRDLEDAVLKVTHGLIRQDRGVANEFLAFFLYDLQRLGKFSMSSSSRLRRFLDTGDLVHSVIGDLWKDIPSLDFESRNQFLHLFARRMGWKAADNARRLASGARREDRRLFLEPEQIERPDGADAIPDQLIRAEERDRLMLVLLRLKPRDGKLLALRLKGLEIHEIADQMGLKYDTARKALARALDQARALIDSSERRRPQPDPHPPT